MKNTNIPWIGCIPDEWGTIRFKDWCVCKKEVAGERSGNFQRLALTLNGVIKRAKDDSEGLQPKEFDTYQILEENDFIFKMIDLQNISTSRVGLSPFTGLVSPAYLRFVPRNKGQFNKFIYYYLMSLYYNCVFNNMGDNGVRSALNSTDMGNLICPFPALSIQIKIANFLDAKILEIDSLIAVEEDQIKKLQEYKINYVSEVVTKGLFNAVSRKRSGYDWIGDIPSNWEIQRVKNIGQLQNGISKGGDSFGSGYPFVSYGDVYKNWCLPVQASGLIESLPDDRQRYSVEKGDIFFTRTSETIEEVGFSSVCLQSIPDAVFAGFLIRLRPYNPDQKLNSRYATYYFRANVLRKYLVKEMNIVTRASLGQDLLGAMPVLLPPIDEQEAIADHLDSFVNCIDEAIGIKNKKITLLRELRQNLIYECVTGKKEVA